MEHENDGAKLEEALHQMAADFLDKGMVDEAWKTSSLSTPVDAEKRPKAGLVLWHLK